MAHYDITYSCGHTGRKELYGNGAQRSSYIAWAAKSGICPTCAMTDEAAACEAMEAERGLPALEGSDKQVLWARNLRAKAVADIDQQITKIDTALALTAAKATPEILARAQAAATAAKAAFGAMTAQTASRWWIDESRKGSRTAATKLLCCDDAAVARIATALIEGDLKV